MTTILEQSSPQQRFGNRERRKTGPQPARRVPRGRKFGRVISARYWTPDRCLVALREWYVQSSGPLPAARDYDRLTKGRNLPTSVRLREYFVTVGRAWLAADAPRSRVPTLNGAWSQAEDEYLRESAGEVTRADMARHLHRSEGVVHRQLFGLGINARSNQGFISASALAVEIGCSVQGVYALVESGGLKAIRRVKNRYDIDPADVTDEVRARLRTTDGRARGKRVDRAWFREDVDQARNLRLAGQSWAEIAAVFGVNYRTIYDIVLDSARPRPHWKAVWRVVKQLSGNTERPVALVEVAHILRKRGTWQMSEQAAISAARRASKAKPDQLRVGNGTAAIVKFTSRRVRPNQRRERRPHTPEQGRRLDHR